MQSVRLKNSLTFPRSARSRQFPYFLSAFLVAVGMLPWAAACHAQDTKTAPAAPETKEKYDIGIGGFYQVTHDSNGNFIREDTTESGGAWSVSGNRIGPGWDMKRTLATPASIEAYNKGVVKVESNVTDFSFSYLLQSPTVYGVQPFLRLGGGIIVFSPISGP